MKIRFHQQLLRHLGKTPLLEDLHSSRQTAGINHRLYLLTLKMVRSSLPAFTFGTSVREDFQ
jgi:hypothetical protein